MIQQYDIVSLTEPLPKKNLKKGTKGTVVEIYDEPPLPPGYEVEFVDDNGTTVALITLSGDEIRLSERVQ